MDPDRRTRNKFKEKKSLAVGEACMAVGWPTPDFKGRTFDLWVLNRRVFNNCICCTPLWGAGDMSLWHHTLKLHITRTSSCRRYVLVTSYIKVTYHQDTKRQMLHTCVTSYIKVAYHQDTKRQMLQTSDTKRGGDAAQWAECQTGMPLTQVRFPSVTRDSPPPPVNFRCRLSYIPACNRIH